MNIKKKPILYGIIAVLIVFTINFSVLYLLDFPIMAMEIIKKYFILIALLIFGFGAQIGLFVYFRNVGVASCSTAAVSGGTSTISMILCCSHYLFNALPFLGGIIGISSLIALSKYTIYFLLFGILSNIIGIGITLYRGRK